MFWLIIIAAAILGTILVIKYGGWALGDPIPPPPPTPFITSAISTSAHTVHLVLYKGPAAVQLERYRPQDSTTYTFTTTLKEVNDTDLERDTLYRYRARYMPGSWSPQKEARTLALVDALNKGPLTFSDRSNDDWAGFCMVQRFQPGVLSHSGSQVSLTLVASPVGLSIDRIFISQADEEVGMDPYDSVLYRVAIQDTLFNPPLVIEPSALAKSMVLPAIDYTLDHTKPLLIAVEFSATPVSGIMYREVPPQVAVAYYKLQAPLQPGEEPEARKIDRDGYERWPVDSAKGGIYLIERIEVA